MSTTSSRRTPHPADVRELRIRAALLLKALWSDKHAVAAAAAERFRLLPTFADWRAAELLARRPSIQRKHALSVIAREVGYASWAELRDAVKAQQIDAIAEHFFDRNHSAFLNRWFSSHAAARASLEAEGGFLFPFRNQFFVCEREFLEAFGIDALDPAWAQFGFDWARPSDGGARDRIAHQVLQRRSRAERG